MGENQIISLNEKRDVYHFYSQMSLLGQGHFGKVYKVQHKETGMIRVLKVISKKKIEGEPKLLEETHLMSQLDHPNIVKVMEMFSDKDHYYLVSEFCQGGELFERVRKMKQITESKLAAIMKQILSAIIYCHNKGIVHRDLKSENILFDSTDNIKIIDFGASAKINTTKLHEKIGTVQDFPPTHLISPITWHQKS